MPVTSLSALERQLEACLIELETLQRSRASLPSSMAHAEAGRQIDEL